MNRAAHSFLLGSKSAWAAGLNILILSSPSPGPLSSFCAFGFCVFLRLEMMRRVWVGAATICSSERPSSEGLGGLAMIKRHFVI